MTEPAGELWLINEPFHQTDMILRPLIFFKTIDIRMTQGKLIATKTKQSEIVLNWFEKSFLIWSKKFISSNGCFLKFQYFSSLCFDWLFSCEFNNLSQAQLIYGGSSRDQTKTYKFYPFHSHFPLLFCFGVSNPRQNFTRPSTR